MGLFSFFSNLKKNTFSIPKNFCCPYCNGNLPAPIRKRKCPHCRKTIFARSRPNHPQVWVREEDVPLIEKEWCDYHQQKELDQSYDAVAREYSGYISKQEIKAVQDRIERQSGSAPSFAFDVRWGVYNALIQKISARESDKSQLFQTLASVYYAMAQLLIEEQKNPYEMLRVWNEMSLKATLDNGTVKSVKIYSAGDEMVCDVCQRLHGKIYSMKDALAEMPLPPKDCSNCFSEMEEDENGEQFETEIIGCRCYWRPEEISLG